MGDFSDVPKRDPDPEAEGKGLLVVDFLSLGKRFSWRRYREDLSGFLLAWGVVGFLILSLLSIGWLVK